MKELTPKQKECMNVLKPFMAIFVVIASFWLISLSLWWIPFVAIELPIVLTILTNK